MWSIVTCKINGDQSSFRRYVKVGRTCKSWKNKKKRTSSSSPLICLIRETIRSKSRSRWSLSTSIESSGETIPDCDNSRVTTVDRVAGIERQRERHRRVVRLEVDGGGWRIWLTPLWSPPGELVKISHRPSTCVEHDGKHTQIRVTCSHRNPYRVTVHAREGHGSQVLVHPSSVPLGFSPEV